MLASLTLNQLVASVTPIVTSFNQLRFLFPESFSSVQSRNKKLVSSDSNCQNYLKVLDLLKGINKVHLNRLSSYIAKDITHNVKFYIPNDINEKLEYTIQPNVLKLITKKLLSYNNCQPYRGFKTGRSKVPGVKKAKRSTLFDIFTRFKGNENERNLNELLKEENLKNLLDKTGTEKDKIKISFAEGYIAGELKKSQNKTKYNVFSIVRELIIFIIILGMLFSVIGGPLKQMIFGNGNEIHSEDIDVSFEDIQGLPEAKNELREVVDFLKNPQKFVTLGGKLPKGVLLVGPPGTGKTLLARAVAGEAGVPFFHAVGSEFDEVLVGQGARRVRNLFTTAKEKAPCVIFIDEIDSVGSKRSKSEWHPYANQTVNQLLAEMDGFHKNEGVIVLGATNRKEDLDKALIRPGRFDMEIYVSPPDLQGRQEIFKYYLGKVKTGKDVDLTRLARGTIGYTGADIENMVNQSALRAAKDNMPYVTMRYLEEARDKILMGPEKKSRVSDSETNKITAYHEAGHTLVSYFSKEAVPLHKVTIIPRGLSLGHTASLPDKETYYQTKSQVCALLDTIMGGRAAEELVFGKEKVTSGATDDLRKATAIASEMVKRWGMSEKVGLRVFEDNSNAMVAVNDVSQTITEVLDQEISRILTEAYDRAKSILIKHAQEHHALAKALLKYETLEYDEIKSIIEGRDIRIN